MSIVPDSTLSTMTVRELVAVSGLGLRVLAGADALAREIAWAHASEMADPTEFLRGGELLLLTGLNLPAGPEAQREYLRRLAGAGVAAVAFGVRMVWPEVPPAMVVAAEELGLPLLEVPRPTPFLAITRAVAQAIHGRELAAKDALVAAQRALTSAAVGPGAPPVVLAGLLTELVKLAGGTAVLLDGSGAVLAAAPVPPDGSGVDVSVPPDGSGVDVSGPADGSGVDVPVSAADLDRLREAPGPASLVARYGAAEVWAQSLVGGAGGRRGSGGGEPLGFLVVTHERAPGHSARQVVNAAVPLCTLLLDRSRTVGRAGWRLRAGMLRLLLAGAPDALGLVAEAAGELWHGMPAEPLNVLVGRGGRLAMAAVRDRLTADRRVASARVLFAELDGILVVIASEGPPTDSLLRVLAQVDGLRLGVSSPAGYPELGRARDEARRAAEYRGGTVVSRFAELPRDLLDLLPARPAAEFSAAVLRPLLDEPGDLTRSLRAWLAHHGQWDPAAAELGVHRHTLRNRIRKVERLLGRELDSADLRAELWLALRLSERRTEGVAGSRGTAPRR
ncbi:PucR family transcriptional regulator [Pseudonocardia eucalypti]|uniref:PucR family transcriptional regulator n=1 Tax=Pseudonocardia eucalypti TaxID=648755 RepID=A0ABP9R3K5_9PSEU|nr:purine catabolism regulator [Pseudonocardia eucalypti]